MTYQHALRYLTAETTPASGDAQALMRAYVGQSKGTATPLLVGFHRNKLGSIAALMLRSVLNQAGMRCLHWIDDANLAPKQRFYLNDKPITPPLLARLAGELHELELSSPDTSLSTAERSAALLCRAAAQEECHVILFEAPSDAPRLPLFYALSPRLGAITVLSDKNDRLHESVLAGTRLVITPTYGPAFYRRISDACAASDIRLETIKKSRRSAVTLGSQTLHYGKFPDCRIPCGTSLCATAAFLAMECVTALERLHLPIQATAVPSALSRVDLSCCCSVRSIQPLLLCDCAQTQAELLTSLTDLSELSAALPSPRRLWLEKGLSADLSLLPHLFDEVPDGNRTPHLEETGTTVVIGSSDFIENFIKTARQKPKKG